jgi:hypothetical protein
MVLRWVAAGMGEATKQFRCVNGHLHLAALRAALHHRPCCHTCHEGGCRLIIRRTATQVPR